MTPFDGLQPALSYFLVKKAARTASGLAQPINLPGELRARFCAIEIVPKVFAGKRPRILASACHEYYTSRNRVECTVEYWYRTYENYCELMLEEYSRVAGLCLKKAGCFGGSLGRADRALRTSAPLSSVCPAGG